MLFLLEELLGRLMEVLEKRGIAHAAQYYRAHFIRMQKSKGTPKEKV